MIEKLESTPRLLLRKRKKGLSFVGPLKLGCGEVVADALQMSEHFVNSFSSVFVSISVISGEY